MRTVESGRSDDDKPGHLERLKRRSKHRQVDVGINIPFDNKTAFRIVYAFGAALNFALSNGMFRPWEAC